MKKLMIMAAIVCAAAAAQAISMPWNITVANAILDPEKGTGFSGKMLVTCTAVGLSQELDFTNGTTSQKTVNIESFMKTDYEIVLSGTTSSGNYTYSETITRQASTDSFSRWLTADFTGGDNWTAVPEPTSGLLLLLGVAGLALRRRNK